MNISITPEQQKWLETQISCGNFASVEDAVQLAVNNLMAYSGDDFAWVKPLLAEAEVSLAKNGGSAASLVIAEWQSQFEKQS
ncbi:MAG: hypothetical protein EB059_06195 [Alphaproteobacteria bacterium]|nr:hypothetical protein [Alphaproteobacteria bacterium]